MHMRVGAEKEKAEVVDVLGRVENLDSPTDSARCGK